MEIDDQTIYNFYAIFIIIVFLFIYRKYFNSVITLFTYWLFFFWLFSCCYLFDKSFNIFILIHIFTNLFM